MSDDIDQRLKLTVKSCRDDFEKSVKDGALGDFYDNNVYETSRRQSLVGNKWQTNGYILLLGGGGPTVYLDTWECAVQGSWGSSKATSEPRRSDCDAIDDYLNEIYGSEAKV